VTTYLASAALDQLDHAQAEVDRQVAAGLDGRCLSCGEEQPCTGLRTNGGTAGMETKDLSVSTKAARHPYAITCRPRPRVRYRRPRARPGLRGARRAGLAASAFRLIAYGCPAALRLRAPAANTVRADVAPVVGSAAANPATASRRRTASRVSRGR
jgi:hypothetical protein